MNNTKTAIAALLEKVRQGDDDSEGAEEIHDRVARRHFAEMVALLERMQDWDQLTSAQIAGLAYEASEDARILLATLEEEAAEC